MEPRKKKWEGGEIVFSLALLDCLAASCVRDSKAFKVGEEVGLFIYFLEKKKDCAPRSFQNTCTVRRTE